MQTYDDERARFGALRELLQRAPSGQLWQELLTLWRTWPVTAATYQEALPYAHAHLERWPKELDQRRVWDMAWLHDAAPPVWASLARAFYYKSEQLGVPARYTGLAPLLIYAKTIRYLHLEGLPLAKEELETLLKLTGPSLETLALGQLHLSSQVVVDALMGVELQALRSLSLRGLFIQEAQLERLMTLGWFEQLEGLGLSLSRFAHEQPLHQLIGRPWERLRELSLSSEQAPSIIDAIVRREPFKQLQHLKLYQSASSVIMAPLPGAYVERLWLAPALQSLKSLRVGSFAMSAQTLAFLYRPSAMRGLEDLQIDIFGGMSPDELSELERGLPPAHPNYEVILRFFDVQRELTKDFAGTEEFALLQALSRRLFAQEGERVEEE